MKPGTRVLRQATLMKQTVLGKVIQMSKNKVKIRWDNSNRVEIVNIVEAKQLEDAYRNRNQQGSVQNASGTVMSVVNGILFNTLRKLRKD